MPSVPQRKLDREIGEPASPLRAPVVPTPEPLPESFPPPPSAEEIYRLIQVTAYFKAQARGFGPGVEMQDWLEAEEEVRQRLKSS
jgi:hypothetical protein